MVDRNFQDALADCIKRWGNKLSEWSEFEDLCEILDAESVKFYTINASDLRQFVLMCFQVDWGYKIKESVLAMRDLRGDCGISFEEMKTNLIKEVVYPSQIIQYAIQHGYLKRGNYLILNYLD
jgi:hypothetical protein